MTNKFNLFENFHENLVFYTIHCSRALLHNLWILLNHKVERALQCKKLKEDVNKHLLSKLKRNRRCNLQKKFTLLKVFMKIHRKIHICNTTLSLHFLQCKQIVSQKTILNLGVHQAIQSNQTASIIKSSYGFMSNSR